MLSILSLLSVALHLPFPSTSRALAHTNMSCSLRPFSINTPHACSLVKPLSPSPSAAAGVVLFIRVRSLYYPSLESIAPLSAPLWTFKRHLDAPHSGQHSFRPSPPLPIALPVLHSNPAFSASGAPPGAGEQVQGAAVQVQTVAVQPQGAAEQPYLTGVTGVGAEHRPMHLLNTDAGPRTGAGMGAGAGRMAGTGTGAEAGPRMGASMRAGLPGLATPSGGTPTHTQPSTPMSFLDAPGGRRGGPLGAAAGENVA